MVERQKLNAATSADPPDAATPNDLDTLNAIAVDDMDSESLYYRQAHAVLPSYEDSVPSSLGLDHAPIQWHTPSISSVTPSPHIPHTFDTMFGSGILPSPARTDVTIEGLFGLKDTDSSRHYFQQQTAVLAESNENALTRSQRMHPSEIFTISAATTPSSAYASPLYRSCVTAYSPSGGSSASSTSSMEQTSAGHPSNHGSKLCQTRPPLLHVATRTRKKSMVRLLLRRGVSTINEPDTNGRTALHVAAQYGDEEMVETLLKNGADPEILDKDGLDALHSAVEHGHEEVAEMLLDALAQRE